MTHEEKIFSYIVCMFTAIVLFYFNTRLVFNRFTFTPSEPKRQQFLHA